MIAFGIDYLTWTVTQSKTLGLLIDLLEHLNIRNPTLLISSIVNLVNHHHVFVVLLNSSIKKVSQARFLNYISHAEGVTIHIDFLWGM